MSTPTPSLAAAGSSIYDSNTVGLHVGDGTWDSSRDDFLLPNLVGFPFSVMRYNGMGNRFAGEPLYLHIVTGHGVMAAITFLFIVPAAIMIARFHHRNPILALRMHVWLQIITIFLATVVLVLGWFAVGPARSLSNPHHGIGVAIYTLILFQAIFGAWVRHHESKRVRDHIPMKLMVISSAIGDCNGITNLNTASSSSRASHCAPCHCSSCTRTDSVRFTEVPLRPVHSLGYVPACIIFNTLLSSPGCV